MPLEAPVIMSTGSSAIARCKLPDRSRHNRGSPVDPDRKRKIRLVVALSAAVLLAAGLVYTSFSASTEAKEPSQLLQSDPSGTYELTGEVVPGSIQHAGDQ